MTLEVLISCMHQKNTDIKQCLISDIIRNEGKIWQKKTTRVT